MNGKNGHESGKQGVLQESGRRRVPDGGAELFPFELIEELREEYLVL